MTDFIKLSILVTVLVGFLQPSIVTAENAYVPIRQLVARGMYTPPNYLSTVNGAIGRENAYQMFSNVVEARYGGKVSKLGKDEALVRYLQKQRIQRNIFLGLYSEDRFVKMNPEWKKVKDPFATQRDVWRKVNGQLQYGQIKVHGIGKSASTLPQLAEVYLASMRKDSGRGQASLFLVPNDHLDAISSHIDKKRTAALTSGKKDEAAWLQKQKDRLSPLGVTFKTLSREGDLAEQGSRSRIVARYAGPVIAVAFIALSPLYETYRWSSGKISGSELGLNLGKSGATLTLSIATSFLVSKSEFLRNSPYRAGGAVAGVIFIAEEGFLIYQYGGFSNAFSAPGFWIQSGGNFGAAALGLIGMGEGAMIGSFIGTSILPGPGTIIGGILGGVVGGYGGGVVGYLGGAWVTDWLLETMSPEFYYGMKVDSITKMESKFSKQIENLRDLSKPLASVGYLE